LSELCFKNSPQRDILRLLNAMVLVQYINLTSKISIEIATKCALNIVQMDFLILLTMP